MPKRKTDPQSYERALDESERLLRKRSATKDELRERLDALVKAANERRPGPTSGDGGGATDGVLQPAESGSGRVATAPEGISKIQVARGVYWVDIPGAGLRVLCGCPADSVKLLARRGLIVTTERGGATFETGPNAILLSDVMIQNGQIANLAEFPVLQMMYRQGMILPNHPNNTGTRPLLVGVPDILKAQSEYIYRGNYGLVSAEELMSAGISKGEARQHMRLKLRFAFDTIRSTDELIDLRPIDGDAVHLRNGVFLHRLGLNSYEFIWEGQTVSVDLNLKPKEEYESSYQLGVHDVAKEYFSVVHIGEGDGWDVILRNRYLVQRMETGR